MARTSSPPRIDKQTKGQLLAYVNSHTSEQRMALRAGIILDWIDEATYDESIKKRDVSRHTIAKWRKRFKTKGLEGLQDKQRSGKPPTITIAQRKKVVHLACSKPPDGRQR